MNSQNGKVLVLGDSHSRSFSFNENFLPMFIGQGKEFNFVSDENLNNIITGIRKVLSTINEKNVLLTFGEPDTRFYLGKGWTPWTQEGEDNLAGFENKIEESVKRFRILVLFILENFNKNVIVNNITPSLRRNQNILVNYFNCKLKEMCQEVGVSFLDLEFEKMPLQEIELLMGDVVHCSNKIQPLAEKWFIEMKMLEKPMYNVLDWDNKTVHSQFEYDEKFGCYKLKNMKNFCYIDKDAVSNQKLLEMLKNQGIAVIENYFSDALISDLNKEFILILDNYIQGIKTIDYSVGLGKVIHKHDADFSKLSKTKSIFYNTDFQQIANQYLKVDNELNKEIFVVKDVVGSKHHANDMHFDVVPTFKFFVYLTDTNEENGAFCCVPGTHKRTADIRKELGSEISYENRYLSRKLPYTDDEVISVNGKAGTLIIFDTDVFHKAGHVSKGERRVMRGHTRPKVNDNVQKVASHSNKEGFLKKVLKKIVKK